VGGDYYKRIVQIIGQMVFEQFVASLLIEWRLCGVVGSGSKEREIDMQLKQYFSSRAKTLMIITERI